MIEIISPCPVLNTPNFQYAFGGKNGSEIPLNERGHPHCFEFVALKGTVFQLEEVLKKTGGYPIYRVSSPFYKTCNLFIDSRFGKPAFALNKKPELPEKKTILKRIIDMEGAAYVWGGNWSAGIPEMSSYYPPKTAIDEHTAILWNLKGVDCSGLLFEATLGATPRNTFELIEFGQAVPLDSSLEPLDMIIYPGHVLFVVDQKTTIESKFPFGVIKRKLSERLALIEAERKRVEEWRADLDPSRFYVVRRFL